MPCLRDTHHWLSLLALIFANSCLADTDFIRVSSYIEQHPAQAERMQTFADIVRQPAKPLLYPRSKKIKIAVIYPGVQNSDYWRLSLTTLKSRLNELGINYHLNTFLSRPGVDIELQAEQLAEALASQPDYLIFGADALKHKSAIQRILLRGKPKLILQNITTPVKRWHAHPPLLYTGFDHELGTQILAERMLQNTPAKYAMLFFSPGYVSQMRGGTFISAAQPHTEIQQVASFYVGAHRGKARAATIKALEQSPNLSMVFACATDIALGVSDALDQTNKHQQVTVNGWGGGEAELAALREGKLDLTVMRLNDDASVAMAEAIKLDISGQTAQIPQIYSGEMVLLDQNTTTTEIQQFKARAFRYSHQQPSPIHRGSR